MKIFLAIVLFAGVALGSSVHRYGWTPSKELTFRFESQVLTGIPEIHSQFGGLKLSSTVRVQTQNDYSLRIKLESSRFVTVNGRVSPSSQEEGVRASGEGESESDSSSQETQLPEWVRKSLEKPFLVHLKRGVVQSFFVEDDEPVVVTNIKKALLSQLQMDLSGSGRIASEQSSGSNKIQIGGSGSSSQSQQSLLEPLESGAEISYLSTVEESLHGDCQTDYSIHPLPAYRAVEMEEQWEAEEQKLNGESHLQGGLSQGKNACGGKTYWQITKTKNFDNCVNRPVFQKWTGVKANCDTTKAGCKDTMIHLSSTSYIVCGELNEFTIRKSVTKNTIMSNPTGWNTEEKMKSTARVSLELLKEGPIESPIHVSANKEKKSLIFEFPEQTVWSPRPIHSQMSEQEQQKEAAITGQKPILPKPDLYSAPKQLIPVSLTKQEIAQQIAQQMKKIAREVFESPESCSKSGDVAGHLATIAQSLRSLSFDDIKYVESSVIESLSESGLSGRHLTGKAIQSLFHDVLSLVGTNPSTMIIKQKIEQGKITGQKAVPVIQSSMRAVRTPTKQLISELVKLVKSIKQQASSGNGEKKALFSAAAIHLSNLIYKACVNPSSMINEFPVKVYGSFCTAQSEVITGEYIPFLESILESSSSSTEEHFRLLAISALGKTGHVKALTPLAKAISGSITMKPLTRSLAVYSLKRIAKMNPTELKPIVLALINNPSENAEVRIAAVSVLPWAQPTTSELQQIAVRSWFEPSKQVAAFIYSTLKSLSQTEVPELKIVGEQAKPLIRLVKPFHFGVQFSHNSHFAKFVEYLRTSVSKKLSWVNAKESMIPARLSVRTDIFGGSWTLRGFSFTAYTQGMDAMLDKWLYVIGQTSQVSQSVKDQLQHISQELKIKSRSGKHTPEMILQRGFMGYEHFTALNEEFLVEAIEKATEELRESQHAIFGNGQSFAYSRAVQALDVQIMGPTDAGFPVYIEQSLPIVYSFKGFFQAERKAGGNAYLPKMVKGKLIPVINAKLETNMGVICPFTQQFLGSGVEMGLHLSAPTEAKIEMEGSSQISITLKTPEEIRKQMEIVHIFVTPYTAQKSLKSIKPISKSGSIKTILSGKPLKKANLNIGEPLKIDSRLLSETDATYADLYSYWTKLQQHNLASLESVGLLPSSLRMASTKIVFDPTNSQTKEIKLKLHLSHGQSQSGESGSLSLSGGVSDEQTIKSICMETFSRSSDVESCIDELINLEEIAENVNELCILEEFRSREARERCFKTASICKKATDICERVSPASEQCKRMERECFDRIVYGQGSMHKVAEKLQNGVSHSSQQSQSPSSYIVSVGMSASLKSASGHETTVRTALTLGAKTEQSGRLVKTFGQLEIRLPHMPASERYQIELETAVQMPKIAHRWSVDSLLREAIKSTFETKLSYGFKQSGSSSGSGSGSAYLSEIIVKGHMEKTEEQRRAVLASPEYTKCIEEERSQRKLVSVCSQSRHEAASVDKFVVLVSVPEMLARQPALRKLEDAVKAYFLTQITEEKSYQSTVTSPREIKITAVFGRVGSEAQIKIERSNVAWKITNVRLPSSAFRNVLPLSLRNPIPARLIQKISQGQSPASCRVEPTTVGTFDNKTYSYELNSCWHLLTKDCSGKSPVAVLAKGGEVDNKKAVKILSGVTIVEMKPTSTSSGSMLIKVIVKGGERIVDLSKGQTFTEKCSTSGKVLVEMKRYSDDVYAVVLPQENLEVLFDGHRVEIVAPQMLKSRACGLCGDLNGENTADMKTPRECVMSQPKLAAFAYMLNKEGGEGSCQGIPSQYRTKYERESRQCIKEREIPTPLSGLVKRVRSGLVQKPIISVHAVEKQTGKLCISKQKINVCSGSKTIQISKPYLQGSQPESAIPKAVEFVCITAPSSEARSIQQRAEAGETLSAELQQHSTVYRKTVYEPVLCKSSTHSQEQQQQEESHSNGYGY